MEIIQQIIRDHNNRVAIALMRLLVAITSQEVNQ